MIRRINNLACLLTLAITLYNSQFLSAKTVIDGISRVESAENAGLIFPALVDRFYQLNNQQLIWFAPGENSLKLRQELKNLLDSAVYNGLNKNSYHYKDISETALTATTSDSTSAINLEKLYTDAAIALCLGLYQGDNISRLVSYDGVSASYKESDHEHILKGLSGAHSAEQLSSFVASLEPDTKEYKILKASLREQPAGAQNVAARQLITAMNYLRWINHFMFDKYIVINLASATGTYYESGNEKLTMRTIVGKPSTKTPRFAAYCDQVILYPYWNVPQSIAANEILPKVKRDPSVLAAMNMEVINSKGKIVDPYSVNWSAVTGKNLSYRFRQSTGCDNALGVIKFNLTAPFSVYMHDTNSKSLFRKDKRYYSHGCIRLEEPLKLANYLTGDKISSSHVKACYKNQQPETIKLERPVPVFVVYIPSAVNDREEVTYYKDVYNLLK